MIEEIKIKNVVSGWNPVETLPEHEVVSILVFDGIDHQVMRVVKVPNAWHVLQSANVANGIYKEIGGVKSWMPVIECECREDANRILRKRVFDAGGGESCEVA